MFVMPGLVPGIHVLLAKTLKAWMAGTSPAMTLSMEKSPMPAAYPEEAKNFLLLGHDPSAAWGGGSLVQVHKGHAYVGAVGGSSFNGPEGFTLHDVRDPRRPKKVGEFRAPPGVHCHKLRIVGDDLLYVNSERLAGDKRKNARAGFFIFDVSTPATPKP